MVEQAKQKYLCDAVEGCILYTYIKGRLTRDPAASDQCEYRSIGVGLQNGDDPYWERWQADSKNATCGIVLCHLHAAELGLEW